MLRSGRYRIAGYDPSHTALRTPRERYHMLQLVGWAGIKPALLLFLSAFTDVRRCLFPRFRPSAEMGALSWKRQAAAGNGISPVGTGGTLAETLLRQREVRNARFAVLLMGS